MITKFKRQYPADWLNLLEEFRRVIQRFTTSNTNTIYCSIPSYLNQICQELHGKDLKSVIESSSYLNEITIMSYIPVFRFKADSIIKLLTPTIDSIINSMKNTLTNSFTNGLSNIIMVGGWSECPMIQDEVQKAFPENQIIIPEDAALSVLIGAVLFGHRPDYNRSELCDEGCIGK